MTHFLQRTALILLGDQCALRRLDAAHARCSSPATRSTCRRAGRRAPRRRPRSSRPCRATSRSRSSPRGDRRPPRRGAAGHRHGQEGRHARQDRRPARRHRRAAEGRQRAEAQHHRSLAQVLKSPSRPPKPTSATGRQGPAKAKSSRTGELHGRARRHPVRHRPALRRPSRRCARPTACPPRRDPRRPEAAPAGRRRGRGRPGGRGANRQASRPTAGPRPRATRRRLRPRAPRGPGRVVTVAGQAASLHGQEGRHPRQDRRAAGHHRRRAEGRQPAQDADAIQPGQMLQGAAYDREGLCRRRRATPWPTSPSASASAPQRCGPPTACRASARSRPARSCACRPATATAARSDRDAEPVRERPSDASLRRSLPPVRTDAEHDAPRSPSRPQPYRRRPPRPTQRPRRRRPPPRRSTAPPVAPQAGSRVTDAQIIGHGPRPFVWPVRGDILSDFGPKPGGQRNDGVNIRPQAGDAGARRRGRRRGLRRRPGAGLRQPRADQARRRLGHGLRPPVPRRREDAAEGHPGSADRPGRLDRRRRRAAAALRGPLRAIAAERARPVDPSWCCRVGAASRRAGRSRAAGACPVRRPGRG